MCVLIGRTLPGPSEGTLPPVSFMAWFPLRCRPLTIVSFHAQRNLPFHPLTLPDMPLLDGGLGGTRSTPFSQYCEFVSSSWLARDWGAEG